LKIHIAISKGVGYFVFTKNNVYKLEQTTQDAEKYLQSRNSLTYRKTPYGNWGSFCFTISPL